MRSADRKQAEEECDERYDSRRTVRRRSITPVF